MRKIPAWIVIIVVIALLIAIKLMFFPKKNPAATAAGKKPSGPVAVNYYVAKEEEISNKVYTTGKTGAFNEIELRPEVSGKITAVYFKEGENVNKGEPIIKINDADLQAQLQKNKIQVKLAEEKLERLKKLLAVSGISKEEYDIQENELAALKADQSFIQAQLAKTHITAPFGGVIGLKNISEGAYVSPQQVIANLVQLSPLYIEFSVPEKYSASVKKGSPVQFASEQHGAKTFTAQVYALEPRVDESTKSIRARAVYNGKENFFPGTFVKVYVELGSHRSIMIPSQSLIPIMKGQKVFVSKNGTAMEVKVATGIRTEDKIQILEGLHPGDTVLTSGIMSVKNETKIRLVKSGN